jgi:hypothetical protein
MAYIASPARATMRLASRWTSAPRRHPAVGARAVHDAGYFAVLHIGARQMRRAYVLHVRQSPRGVVGDEHRGPERRAHFLDRRFAGRVRLGERGGRGFEIPAAVGIRHRDE